MTISVSAYALGLIAEFARNHHTGGIWVTDGEDTRCLFAGPNHNGSGNCGTLVLKYPLRCGLDLLVGVAECRQLDTEAQAGLRRVIAAMERQADANGI